jgi:hypothetical protein
VLERNGAATGGGGLTAAQQSLIDRSIKTSAAEETRRRAKSGKNGASLRCNRIALIDEYDGG